MLGLAVKLSNLNVIGWIYTDPVQPSESFAEIWPYSLPKEFKDQDKINWEGTIKDRIIRHVT